MKFLRKMKDGGPESSVTGYWLIEIKSLFSIVLLKFEGESRDAYHEHAFNCWNWLIKGLLHEKFRTKNFSRFREGFSFSYFYTPSWKPFYIAREDFHKVDSMMPTSWVLSFRGPWRNQWKEYLPLEDRERTLTHGRVEI
jgi:hypothetical protein